MPIASTNIKHCIKFFVGFFVVMMAYQLLYTYKLERHWQGVGTQHNPAFRNDSIIEYYALHWQNYPVVITGSSVATMLPPEPKRVRGEYTLFLQGNGPMTGLEAILRTKAAPAIVLIEADFFDRDVNPQLIENTFQPFTRWLRKWIPLLRYNQNIVNVFSRYRQDALQLDTNENRSAAEWHQKIKANIDAGLPTLQRPECIPPQKERLILGKLRHQVNDLEKRGTRVIFYMNAFDPEINQTNCMRHSHSVIKKMFPDHQFISAPALIEGKPLYTSDGFHIIEESGARYFHYLMHASGAEQYLGDSL